VVDGKVDYTFDNFIIFIFTVIGGLINCVIVGLQRYTSKLAGIA